VKNGIFFYTKLHLTNSALPDYPYFHAHSPDTMPSNSPITPPVSPIQRERGFYGSLPSDSPIKPPVSPIQRERGFYGFLPSDPPIKPPVSPIQREEAFYNPRPSASS
jgi:hypothetical protein